MYAYLPLLALGICKNIGIRTYFDSVTAESVRFSHHFPCAIKVPRLATFLIHLRTAFFESHLLSPLKIWQLWVPKRYKVFIKTPLYHC